MGILKKYRYLLLGFLLLLVLGFGAYYFSYRNIGKSNSQSAVVEEKNISYKLSINTGVKKLDFEGTVKDGATVFDILKKVSADNNFSFVYKESDLGAFIEEIYGIKNDVGANKYWMYKVNGQLANVGASGYKINNGDVIEWYYGQVEGF